ncbi:ABC transporter permease [Streptococcus uberis]|uniref:ABC transporter permease n=1 Tax=Streptococcus uberis TaxID=1349 RepID=UPI0027DC86AB|nr:ABC transporter permease [Streptococcus uberis]MCK1234293.1 ABC transporter permease [Streptococcus uberis]
MKEILIVCKETFLRQVKSWSFVLMVLSPFLFLAFSAGIGYVSGSSAEKSNKIAIILPQDNMKAAFKQLDHVTFEYKDVQKAKKDLKSDKILAYITLSENNQVITAKYFSKEEPSQSQKALLTQSLNGLQQTLNVAKAQISPKQLETLSTQAKLDVQTTSHTNYDKISKYISFYGVTFIMYMILIIYTSQTAQEIASEKGTKIMEVIFSSVPANHYFYGRILGIFAVILTHMTIYVAGGYLCFKLANKLEMTKEWIQNMKPLLDSLIKHLDWSILFFAIFGILLYVVLAALCGSLVVRPEQANQAAQLPIFLVIAAFMGAFVLGQGNSDPLLLKIGSYLPFFSTFFMPIRLINGFAHLNQSLISLLILALTTLFITMYIGKSYSGLILQTDDIGWFKSLKRGLKHK